MGPSVCDRNEEDYHIGGLVIELERCPHIGCGSHFTMNPLKNIALLYYTHVGFVGGVT